MDLSNILLAVWNFKHNFIKVLTPECNVFAHDFRIAIRAKAMQTHYELLFLFFIEIFLTYYYVSNAELAWKYAQIRQNSLWIEGGGKKTEILNFVSDDAERNLWRASEQ